MNLPRISIVTPNLNQGRFLEEAISSVAQQGYQNLEYMVVDGGSDDGSVEIIKRNEAALAWWVSEPDAGQAAAIAKGFARATGDILAWLNADDFLLPGALKAVAHTCVAFPGAKLVVGGYEVISEDGRPLRRHYAVNQDFKSLLCAGQRWGQMACFWSRTAYEEVGGLDQSLQFVMDADLLLKLTRRWSPALVRRVLAAYRLHDQSKVRLWGTLGAVESATVRTRHGIEGFTSDEIDREVREVERRARRAAITGLAADCVRDPKAVASLGWNWIRRRTRALFGRLRAGQGK